MNATLEVKFMGGPFDGHQQDIQRDSPTTETIALPINDNVFQILDGKHPKTARNVVRLAIYGVLQDWGDADTVYYAYKYSVKPSALNLENWKV